MDPGRIWEGGGEKIFQNLQTLIFTNSGTLPGIPHSGIFPMRRLPAWFRGDILPLLFLVSENIGKQGKRTTLENLDRTKRERNSGKKRTLRLATRDSFV